MRKALIIFLLIILSISLCTCSNNTASVSSDKLSTSPAQGKSSPEGSKESVEQDTREAVYPFTDEEGRTHYQIYINGEMIQTEHDAYTYPDEPDGAYYPIVEILKHFGIECLFDEHMEALTTRVNGQIITCKTDSSDIVIGKYTLGGTSPEYIDGCFYVPSYTFMRLLDAVVDFTSDRSGVTITTETTIDTAASGTAGLSISAETVPDLGKPLYSGAQACPTCGGSGRAICTSCSGTGSSTQYAQVRDPISGQYTIRSNRVFCSHCGGSGRAVCPTCGGTGKR